VLPYASVILEDLSIDSDTPEELEENLEEHGFSFIRWNASEEAWTRKLSPVGTA
jgi:hypothetical protein